jgi:PRTRC genetic system protein C
MATRYVYLTGGREVEFMDEQDAYKPEDIKAHWAATFPELSAATWDEKKADDGTRTITFAKKVGTKGAALNLRSQEFIRALARELNVSEADLETALIRVMADGDWGSVHFSCQDYGLIVELSSHAVVYRGPMYENEFTAAKQRLGRVQ